METLSYCQLMERCLAAEARVVELTAENVGLKESRNNLAEFIHEELDADYPLNMNPETHATDRIVAGIKADGVALAKSAFEKHIQSPSCYQDEVIGMESALSIASQVELKLRESTK